MGFYKYLRKTWEKPQTNLGAEEWRNKLIVLRSQPTLTRVDKPTRLDRARALGYKAKQGYFVVRSRVTRGQIKRQTITGGRRPKRWGQFRMPGRSAQSIAEFHVARKYPNAEVLNSYWLAQDGNYKWFEVIMVDRAHPVIKADKKIAWIAEKKGRVYKGMTAAGRKGRGLMR